MEDIIRALLDVVRAQHSAAEGTDEAPFDMNDIVDMAMNIVGRPDESEEVAEMVGCFCGKYDRRTSSQRNDRETCCVREFRNGTAGGEHAYGTGGREQPGRGYTGE